VQLVHSAPINLARRRSILPWPYTTKILTIQLEQVERT
jgi:hypothetical protein